MSTLITIKEAYNLSKKCIHTLFDIWSSSARISHGNDLDPRSLTTEIMCGIPKNPLCKRAKLWCAEFKSCNDHKRVTVHIKLLAPYSLISVGRPAKRNFFATIIKKIEIVEPNKTMINHSFLLEYHSRSLAWHAELMAFEQEQGELLKIGWNAE